MQYYFAPLEGVTGYIYRNAHKKHFEGVDKYFTPFISPNSIRNFTTKELNDILPENNLGIETVPQILSNKSEEFIQTANALYDYGYREVNLNLGCPSGTVVSKGKGSGFLAYPEQLDRFLDDILTHSKMKLSVKTRLGITDPEEFYDLIKIFNKYPIEELTIHPRVQKDFYKNTPNLEVFRASLSSIKAQICYNGDLFKKDDYENFIKNFKEIDRIMLGRGLISNPNLISEIKGGNPLDKSRLKNFHDEVYENYQKVLSGDHNVLFKMKEIWLYMIQLFSNEKKYAKAIKKSDNLREYEKVVKSLFDQQELI
ncbi:MAG: tRNA-dihydrouridine synthase family protein [Clostridiales bacterium]|nr:tRNA-dihydrouridine synthase family protein [Clostridiales bacterium]